MLAADLGLEPTCRTDVVRRVGKTVKCRRDVSASLLAICLHGDTFGVSCNAVTSGNDGVEGGT